MSFEVLGQQGGPRLPQGASGDLGRVVYLYEDFVEEELVSEPADLGAAEAVDLLDLANHGQCPVQTALDVFVDHLRGREHPLGLLEFMSDAVLFLAAQVLGDSARHHAPSQPPAFLLQLDYPRLRPGNLRLSLPLLVVELSP